MKNVLIISYDFPPARTSGVYRPIKFAKYLPKFGWQPYVLTVKNYKTESVDLSLLDDLPADIAIKRAFSFEPLRIQEAIFKFLYKPGKLENENTAEGISHDAGPGGRVSSFIKKHFLSPASRFSKNWLYMPDAKIGWLPLAVMKGSKIIRKEGIDLIYSTSPYETNHLVARILKKLYGIPWTADFRDLWIGNVYRTGLSPRRIKFEEKLEWKVIRAADSVVFIGDKLAEIYRERYPDIAGKSEIIHNGYDEADFASADDNQKIPGFNNMINFMSIGTLYEKSGFNHFLDGLVRAMGSGKIGDDLRFHFVGNVIPMWRRRLSEPRLHNYVRLHGFRPHAECIRLMMSADILLLMPLSDDSKTVQTVVTGKVFEMMRAGKPILMIGRECECADIVRASGLGKFVPLENVELIAEMIVEFYEKRKNGTLSVTPNWDFIRRFERRSLAQSLARLFDKL